MRALLISIFVCVAPSTGTWVTESNTTVEKRCPRIMEMIDIAVVELPKGCVAHIEGMWLSVDEYQRLQRLQTSVAQ